MGITRERDYSRRFERGAASRRVCFTGSVCCLYPTAPDSCLRGQRYFPRPVHLRWRTKALARGYRTVFCLRNWKPLRSAIGYGLRECSEYLCPFLYRTRTFQLVSSRPAAFFDVTLPAQPFCFCRYLLTYHSYDLHNLCIQQR